MQLEQGIILMDSILFLTDTAGLRKKSKVDEDIEFYSVMRTIRAIENADVCVYSN